MKKRVRNLVLQIINSSPDFSGEPYLDFYGQKILDFAKYYHKIKVNKKKKIASDRDEKTISDAG